MSDFTSQMGQVDTSSYSNAKIVKKSVKVGKVNAVQISCSITGEDMQSALNQAGMDSDSLAELGMDFSTMKPIKVNYWIDRKTYRPVKCSVDMTAFMNDIFNKMLTAMQESYPDSGNTSISMKCTTAKSTVVYKNFNNAKSFSYPKSCK